MFCGIDSVNQLRPELASDCANESIKIRHGEFFETDFKQKVIVNREDLNREAIVCARDPAGEVVKWLGITYCVIKRRDDGIRDCRLKLFGRSAIEIT